MPHAIDINRIASKGIARDELETCLSVLIRMTENLNLELQEGEG
jgi:hypothetical protein